MNEQARGRPYMVVEKGLREDEGSCNVCQTHDFDDVYTIDLINRQGNGTMVRFCPVHLVELKKKLKNLP